MASEFIRVLYPVVDTMAATGPLDLGLFGALPITWSTTAPTGADLAAYPIADSWASWVKYFSVLNNLSVEFDYENVVQSIALPAAQTVRNYPDTSLEESDLITMTTRAWRFYQTFIGIPGPNPLDETDFELDISIFNAVPKARFPTISAFWPAISITLSLNVRSTDEYLTSFAIADSATGFNVDFLGLTIPLDITADTGFDPVSLDFTIAANSTNGWFSHGGKWNTSTGALNPGFIPPY